MEKEDEEKRFLLCDDVAQREQGERENKGRKRSL